MRERLSEFTDAEVAVVTFSAPDAVRDYHRRQLAPLTVLVDDRRTAYRAFEFQRGSVWKVWGPKTWGAYARLIRRGRRVRLPTEDTLQLGGDVVIRPGGAVERIFRSADPADRPSVDDLLAAVRRARSSPES